MMIEKTIKDRKFFLREGTLDEYVAKESCYDKCNFDPKDVWFDLGGNIGVFPIYHAHKVSQIHSYEPDKENIEMFKRNIRANEIVNTTLHKQAVVWDNRKITYFFLNEKKNKGAHSMITQRGRHKTTVPCVNINSEIRKHNPNKLKIDIEGAEYELIKAINNWENIVEVIFEYHITALKDSEGVKLNELYEIMRKQGFQIFGKDPNYLGKNWITIVHAKR